MIESKKEFIINNNITTEKEISIQEKKRLIRKKVKIISKNKNGLYRIKIEGKEFNVRKKTLTPFISKKEYKKYENLIIENLYKEKNNLDKLNENITFILEWFNFILKKEEKIELSKNAKKYGIYYIKEKIFPKIDAYISRTKENEKIRMSEIKIMLALAEKHGYECKEKANYDW